MVAAAQPLLQEHGGSGTEEATLVHDGDSVPDSVRLIQEVGGQENSTPCNGHNKVNKLISTNITTIVYWPNHQIYHMGEQENNTQWCAIIVFKRMIHSWN